MIAGYNKCRVSFIGVLDWWYIFKSCEKEQKGKKNVATFKKVSLYVIIWHLSLWNLSAPTYQEYTEIYQV